MGEGASRGFRYEFGVIPEAQKARVRRFGLDSREEPSPNPLPAFRAASRGFRIPVAYQERQTQKRPISSTYENVPTAETRAVLPIGSNSKPIGYREFESFPSANILHADSLSVC
jgi:hypothetical protein